ncbi:MAG TPA: tetratricopeptide repeat protein [Pyrinomonadaceae bacterium]|nr:tetratricopeptide repeat protein [Pyrinomonadaceae bacterium]
MITLRKIAWPPTQLAAKLRKLEWQGRYSEALQDCLEVVDGKACIPALDSASQEERAELLLRYGALIGFCGHISQIAHSQEQSKDFLTKALAEFIDLGNEEKTAECENYIALAYWRIGEPNESLIWLDSSTRRPCAAKSGTRLHTHLIRALVNLEKKEFEKNLALLGEMEDVYLENGDAFLLGSYYSNLGISLKDLGRESEALRYLKLSRHYHGKARHRICQGIAENNLAQLYWLIGDFEKAHRAIGDATKIFRGIGDKTREGFSFDTKANIFVAEKKYANALKSTEKAIDILRRGENAAYLVEAILTKAKTLLYLNRFTDAILALVDAIEIERIKVGEEAVRKLIDEFAQTLNHVSAAKSGSRRTTAGSRGGLNLLIPASLAHYPSYSGVWVHNSNLEGFGLKKGSLAIVVDNEVKRGDLVAIEDLKTGSVNCGIFDREFGLVCLDKGDDEPQLFNEDDVRILGKIVGVGDDQYHGKDEIVVEPLPI